MAAKGRYRALKPGQKMEARWAQAWVQAEVVEHRRNGTYLVKVQPWGDYEAAYVNRERHELRFPKRTKRATEAQRTGAIQRKGGP